jgi:hypothetical protein
MKKLRFFYGKVFSTFQKWTKKMSKIEKLKYFTPKKLFSLHNFFLACGYQKNNFQVVMIILKIFLRKSI